MDRSPSASPPLSNGLAEQILGMKTKLIYSHQLISNTNILDIDCLHIQMMDHPSQYKSAGSSHSGHPKLHLPLVHKRTPMFAVYIFSNRKENYLAEISNRFYGETGQNIKADEHWGATARPVAKPYFMALGYGAVLAQEQDGNMNTNDIIDSANLFLILKSG